MDPNVLDRTKLIVWDLDGTFWDGTLTEGGASFREDQLERVVRAGRLGIVCSIASNNDRAPVRRFLQNHRAWKYFVFPQVHWGDKPTMVREIVAAAQLRPQNVLFLDDLLRIRDAVRTRRVVEGTKGDRREARTSAGSSSESAAPSARTRPKGRAPRTISFVARRSAAACWRSIARRTHRRARRAHEPAQLHQAASRSGPSARAARESERRVPRAAGPRSIR